MTDGTARLLPGTTSLLPRTGRGSAASSSVVYWATLLSSSSVVYLMTSFGVRRSGYILVRVGVCGYVLSCLTLNDAASCGPDSSGAYRILKSPLGVIVGWPGCVLSRGVRIRQTDLIDGEVLPARGYRDGGKDWCRLLPDLVLFRLVVPVSGDGLPQNWMIALSHGGYNP
jgi:hypothetical protein